MKLIFFAEVIEKKQLPFDVSSTDPSMASSAPGTTRCSGKCSKTYFTCDGEELCSCDPFPQDITKPQVNSEWDVFTCRYRGIGYRIAYRPISRLSHWLDGKSNRERHGIIKILRIGVVYHKRITGNGRLMMSSLPLTVCFSLSLFLSFPRNVCNVQELPLTVAGFMKLQKDWACSDIKLLFVELLHPDCCVILSRGICPDELLKPVDLQRMCPAWLVSLGFKFVMNVLCVRRDVFSVSCVAETGPPKSI